MEIVRLKLTPDDVSPPNKRWVEDGDKVQFSPDGGTTWVDDPNGDPRTAPIFRVPARTGGDPRCDAAEGMIQRFQSLVNAFIDSVSILNFVSSAIALVAIFFGAAGIFTSKLFLIAESLLTIGTTVIDEAMTETVYEQIKCIIYCNIDEDGQMSDEQLATIQTQIDTEIGGTPNIVFDLFAGYMGAVQWSNAGATGEYEGDCDECDCDTGCRLYDFTISPYQFEATEYESTPMADWQTGVGWVSVYIPTGGNGYTLSSIAGALACDVTNIELGFTYTQGSCFGSGDAALYIYSQSFAHEFYRLNVCDVPTSPVIFDYCEGDPPVPVTITQLQISATAGVTNDDSDPGGTAVLQYLKVCYVGAAPDGGVPCDACDPCE